MRSSLFLIYTLNHVKNIYNKHEYNIYSQIILSINIFIIQLIKIFYTTWINA
jgi:hypothetical protein